MAALKFKPLDHPSDIGIIVFGNNLKDIFENAALGMFSLISDLKQIEPKETFVGKSSCC